jgi:hypothetical protein
MLNLGYDPKVVYKNLRRPEVDLLFGKKQEALDDISNLQRISLRDKNKATSLLPKIQKLSVEVNQYDKEARKLWVEIKESAKNY